MSEELLLDLLFKIATSLLTIAAKAGAHSLLQQSSVTKAIEATCADFPELEPLRHTLETWCKSDSFREILAQVKGGSRSISQEYIVTSFIKGGNFYAGDETQNLAEQVLNTFAVKLEEQLYTSPQGLYLLAKRQETLFEQQRDRLETLDERILTIQQTQETTSRRLPVAEDREQPRRQNELADHAKMDVARDLIKQGRPAAARGILDTLRKEAAAKGASPELFFRIATNLGACALQFNDYQTANKEFASAQSHEPGNVKGIANSALAKLLLGRPEDALLLSKQVRQVEGRDSHITSIYVRALYELNRIEDVEALLRDEPWIPEDPTCALTLASIRYEQSRYSEAESLARVSLNRTPDEAQTLLLIARAIMTPIQKQLRDDPPLRWRMAEETQKRLIEADSLTTNAVELLRSHDNPARFHEALAIRAVIRIMLGHYEDALSDCDRVLADVPTHDKALGNKALLLLKLDRPSDAIKILERLRFEPESQIPLALAYLDNKEPEKAIVTLRPLFDPEKRDDRQFEIADALLSAYKLSMSDTAAEETIRVISEKWVNDPRALALIARYRRRQGRNEMAIALLQEALAYANDNLRDLLALQLADIYYSLDRYNEAVELYGDIVDKTSNNPITRKYIVSLFNAGFYRETLVLAQSLRGNHDAIPVITELEALVMQYIGDIDRAIELFEKLSQVEPGNVAHRIRIALLHLRRGNRDAAKPLLSNIEPSQINDSSILLQIAQARGFLGMSGVLPLAYRARRIDPRNPEIHLGYVGLFLQREVLDKALLDVNQIAPGCTVHLRNGDNVRIFTIVEDSESNILNGELAPSDQLATKLIGLRKGDRIVLREGGLEDLSYEIIEVQSKYVFAFQETLSNFSTWFPDHTGLSRVEFKEGDFSKIKLALDARQRLGAQALAFYRDKNLTLGAFCAISRNALDVCLGWTHQ